jgi:hypothetical protein
MSAVRTQAALLQAAGFMLQRWLHVGCGCLPIATMMFMVPMQASHVQQVPTLGEYLSLPLPGPGQESHQQQGQHTQPLPQQAAHLQPVSTSPPAAADSVMDQWVYVPDKVLEKYADVIDVATRSSRSCNCFTKVSLILTLVACDLWGPLHAGLLSLAGRQAHGTVPVLPGT